MKEAVRNAVVVAQFLAIFLAKLKKTAKTYQTAVSPAVIQRE
jgi:hypothetical protein